MLILSQNKKIAIASLMVFMVSFTSMFFFLGSKGLDAGHGQADVLNAPTDATHYEFGEILKDESQGVFVTNDEGILKANNKHFCQIVAGCEQWMTKNVFELVDSDGHGDLIAAHAKVLQNSEKVEAVGPVSIDNKLVLLTLDPILGKNKKVTYIAYYLKDLTEKIEALQ